MSSLEKREIEGPSTCVRCGYDLRTIPPNAACPECGESVWHSRRGRLLRYADREWLGRLHRGLRSLRWSLYASAILLLALVLVIVVVLQRGLLGGWLLGALLLFLLAMAASFMRSLSLISAREPGDRRADVSDQARFRVSSLVVAPATVAWLVGGVVPITPRLLWLREAVGAAALLAVWLHALVTYLEADRLQRRCEYRITGWRVPARLVLAVPAIGLALHWLGPWRFMTGAWTPPGSKSFTWLTVISLLAWFEAIGELTRLRVPVAKEIEAADADAGASSDPSTISEP